jgi:alkylhydroperoxidase/carboxymuconolactone decarboxylase family protein YurZ
MFLDACVGTAEATRAAVQAAHAAGASAEEIDETLLLVMPYAGVPRAITAFTIWREIHPGASAVPQVRDRRAEGERTFEEVYGPGTGRIREGLRSLHPELHDGIIEDAYGRILSRRGLSAADRELMAVPMLVALRAAPQAAGHARGALRSGVDRRAIVAAIEIAKPYLTPDELREATRRITAAVLE